MYTIMDSFPGSVAFRDVENTWLRQYKYVTQKTVIGELDLQLNHRPCSPKVEC